MSSARRADTRERIQAAAVDLFMTKGVDKTSLREIADELGITKAALYYHFPSKNALVRGLVEPMLGETDAFLTDVETNRPDLPPDRLLEEYFGLIHRHQRVLQLLIRDLSGFAHLGLEHQILAWRDRLQRLLLGPDPAPEAQVRAIVALGGLSDAAVLEQVDDEIARTVAVDAACAALGIPRSVEASSS